MADDMIGRYDRTLVTGLTMPTNVFVRPPNTFEYRKVRWDKGDVLSRPATGHTFPSSDELPTSEDTAEAED